MLYERGYDKDAAHIAMEAIHYARQQAFDVVLVDTAGRMQNNEPLMRALAKVAGCGGLYTPDKWSYACGLVKSTKVQTLGANIWAWTC